MFGNIDALTGAPSALQGNGSGSRLSSSHHQDAQHESCSQADKWLFHRRLPDGLMPTLPDPRFIARDAPGNWGRCRSNWHRWLAFQGAAAEASEQPRLLCGVVGRLNALGAANAANENPPAMNVGGPTGDLRSAPRYSVRNSSAADVRIILRRRPVTASAFWRASPAWAGYASGAIGAGASSEPDLRPARSAGHRERASITTPGGKGRRRCSSELRNQLRGSEARLLDPQIT